MSNNIDLPSTSASCLIFSKEECIDQWEPTYLGSGRMSGVSRRNYGNQYCCYLTSWSCKLSKETLIPIHTSWWQLNVSVSNVKFSALSLMIFSLFERITCLFFFVTYIFYYYLCLIQWQTSLPLLWGNTVTAKNCLPRILMTYEQYICFPNNVLIFIDNWFQIPQLDCEDLD